METYLYPLWGTSNSSLDMFMIFWIKVGILSFFVFSSIGLSVSQGLKTSTVDSRDQGKQISIFNPRLSGLTIWLKIGGSLGSLFGYPWLHQIIFHYFWAFSVSACNLVRLGNSTQLTGDQVWPSLHQVDVWEPCHMHQ